MGKVARLVGLRVAEAFGVLLLCLLALRLVYPAPIANARTHVWSFSNDPYALGDLGGALYMVVRSAEGEQGCVANTHGVPWSWDICGEIPNPVVTDLLAELVKRFGMPLGYNLGLLLFLASNGLAVYIAVRLAGARGPPALFAAMTATVAPSLVSEIEGGFIQHTWWAPAILATACCVAALSSWKRFWLILPGLYALAWSLSVYAMMPFKLMPWTLAAGAVAVFSGEDRKGKLIRAGLGGLLAVGVLLPFLSSGMESAGARLFEGPAKEAVLMKGFMAHTPGDFFSMSFGSPDLVRLPGILTLVTLAAAAFNRRKVQVWGPVLGASVLLLLISLGPNIGEGPYRGFLPYVWLMDHVDLARGSMRPIRYGVAGMFLLCIACGLSLSLVWERISSPRIRWSGLVILSGLLLLQVRPKSMTPDLAWPPLPSLEALGPDNTVLDIPIGGANERRFAYWAFHPAPRMNPPHNQEKWRALIREPAGMFPLLSLLDDMERNKPVNEARVRLLMERIPEVEEHGLRHILLHKARLEPKRIAEVVSVLLEIGATKVSTEDNVLRYDLSPR
jgi:hypothetical protein